MTQLKRVEDMSPKEAREIGEKLYAETKDAYTVAGSLIGVVNGVGVGLGNFENGTFILSPEGRRLAIEQGYIPEDTGPEPLPDPGSRVVKDGRAQIEETQPIYGVPETAETVAAKPGALPSDVPMRDPAPHPPQPIAGAPAAISHRAGTPDGLPPIPQGEPVMGADGQFYMPVRDRTDFDDVGADGRFVRLDQYADAGGPPLGGGGAEGGVPEVPVVEEPSLITAATLPALDFLQPGNGKDEPDPVHIERPIAVSFPSPGGGSPEYPLEPAPKGTQPPPPPDPQERAIIPQFQSKGGQRVREAELADRAIATKKDKRKPDDKNKLLAEREAAEKNAPEDRFAAERDLNERKEQERQEYTEQATARFDDALDAAEKAAQGPAQKAADERQREATEAEAKLHEAGHVETAPRGVDKDTKDDKKGKSAGRQLTLDLKDDVKAEANVKAT